MTNAAKRGSTDFALVERGRHFLGATGMSAVAGKFCEFPRVMAVGTAVLVILRSETVTSRMGTFITHEISPLSPWASKTPVDFASRR